MNADQRGFTLLELMIVLAIIGVLASLALPMYQDYTVRTKVTEGLSLTAAVKTAVTESYYSKGVMPASNQVLDLPDPTQIRSKYVASVSVADGTITVAYAPQGLGGNPSMDGAKLTLTPTDNGGSLMWQCAVGNQTQLFKYVPAECRN
jgi:type IV pilus assembly protein PilA